MQADEGGEGDRRSTGKTRRDAVRRAWKAAQPMRDIDARPPPAAARPQKPADTLVHGQGVARPEHVLRSEEHTSELQSLMRISYAVFCLKKKKRNQRQTKHTVQSTRHTTIQKIHYNQRDK